MKDRSDDTTEVPTSPVKKRLPRAPGTSPVEVDVSGLSHMGKVRSNNEDHYLIARVGRSLQTIMTNIPDGDVPSRFDQAGWLMMVADGMGGASGGEVASRLAIRTMVNVILDVPDWIMHLDEDRADELMRRAARYYRVVDSTLAEHAQADPQLRGMGTTMTLGYSLGTDLFIAHVGDSRAYLFRDDALRQLTRDHTHVQDLADAGLIERDEVATHRMRHVLTNVLGDHTREVDVELHRLTVQDGDRLLLCTDGLSDLVEDAKISDTLAQTKQASTACRGLVDLALEGGGRDNITAVVADYGVPSGATERKDR